MTRRTRNRLLAAIAGWCLATAVSTSHANNTQSGAEHNSMKQTGNTIVITGGGSGIGRELARRFHALGNTVIVAGRRLEPLRETIGDRDRMHAMLVDVADPASIADFARELVARHPDTNVLVNNAGIMRFEDISRRRPPGDAEATVATNLLDQRVDHDALVEHLATRPDAAIVNVSSGLGFVPRTDAATYSATKAAVHSYSVSLRHVLRGRVQVIELVPPAVQTELTPGQSTRDGYMPLEQFIDEVMEQFTRSPVPDEVLVDRVSFLRRAEAEGRFADTLERLNAH
jgi:uncharacterized oxidoreductase